MKLGSLRTPRQMAKGAYLGHLLDRSFLLMIGEGPAPLAFVLEHLALKRILGSPQCLLSYAADLRHVENRDGSGPSLSSACRKSFASQSALTLPSDRSINI